MNNKTVENSEFKKKELHIFVGFKGGLGKSKIAKHIFPCLIYSKIEKNKKDKLKFNIVEIDDSATVDIWHSDRVICNSYDVSDYKDAIIQIQNTFNNKDTVEIIDIGSGGVKIKQLLIHIEKMKLEDIFELRFFVPTNRDSLIFDSSLSTCKLIDEIFNRKVTLIYNRIIESLEDEFQAYFGNSKWKIMSRFNEIENFLEGEWVITEDRFNLIENAINETKKSALDFFIVANEHIDTFMEQRLNAIDNHRKLEDINKMYDISYDFVDFFKKIKFEVKR